jgi:chromosomal replication initiation ATPase DnaA
MEKGSLKDWITGFEIELKRRFSRELKLIVIDENGNRNDPEHIMPKLVTTIVSKISGVEYDEIVSKKRGTWEVSDARMLSMYFIYMNCKLSKSAIGRFFKKDHTTVIHAMQTIKDRIAANDKDIVPLISIITDAIKQAISFEEI